MKKLSSFLLAFLLLMPLAVLGEAADALTLFVATDLHYLAPELTDHGSCFTQMIERGDGKVMAYSEELVEAFVTQVIARRPDALVLSGDLTFDGERASHEALADKLARVEAAGIPVLVLPGNHDLNNRSAARFVGEGYALVDSVTAEAFRGTYQAFGYDDALSRDRASLSYVAGISEKLRILLVDVNDANPQGEAEAQTLAWIKEQLAQARRDGCRVITVSHQSLLSHSSALFSAGFSIGNAYELYELYAKAPVLCNLSGHIHMQHMRATEEGLWDIATSSLAVSPNQYGVLTITQDELTYRTETVDVSAWAAAKGLHDPNLLDFASYSEGFFKESARRKALAAASQDARPEQLADYFAALNAAYFAGRMDAFSPDTQRNERWKQQPSFLSLYIESILKEPPRNHCTLTLSLESSKTQSRVDSGSD
ncbi:MAG: metallophosphoesterase [Candidatus Ventricola sp.]